MLRLPILPGAFTRVLVTFRPCFTAPTFETFTMMVAGLFAQPVRRTVCGMLTGAGLAQIWHHGRAHRFFSHARWDTRHLGLLLAGLIVTRLLEPVRRSPSRSMTPCFGAGAGKSTPLAGFTTAPLPGKPNWGSAIIGWSSRSW
jgi:hypothetical protein